MVVGMQLEHFRNTVGMDVFLSSWYFASMKTSDQKAITLPTGAELALSEVFGPTVVNGMDTQSMLGLISGQRESIHFKSCVSTEWCEGVKERFLSHPS